MSVVINTAPRVGSKWLTRMLEKLLETKNRPFVTEILNGKEVIVEKDVILMKIHDINPLRIVNLGLKQIILTRNIYDTIVSRIFFDRRMSIEYFGVDNYKGLSDKECIDKAMNNIVVVNKWLKYAYSFINFEHPDVFKCTYEEMKRDCFSVLKRISNYLKIEKTDAEIRNIVKEFPFRKGIVEGMNYLTKEHIKFIDMCR